LSEGLCGPSLAPATFKASDNPQNLTVLAALPVNVFLLGVMNSWAKINGAVIGRGTHISTARQSGVFRRILRGVLSAR